MNTYVSCRFRDEKRYLQPPPKLFHYPSLFKYIYTLNHFTFNHNPLIFFTIPYCVYLCLFVCLIDCWSKEYPHTHIVASSLMNYLISLPPPTIRKSNLLPIIDSYIVTVCTFVCVFFNLHRLFVRT